MRLVQQPADKWSQLERQMSWSTTHPESEPHAGPFDSPIRLGKSGLRLTRRGELVLIVLALLIFLVGLGFVGGIETGEIA